MGVEQTSLNAFIDIQPTMGRRQLMVLHALKCLGKANNTMIAITMKLPINQITPRINELRKKGIVCHAGNFQFPYTHKITMFWRAA